MVLLWYTWELLTIIEIQLGQTRLGATTWYLILFSIILFFQFILSTSPTQYLRHRVSEWRVGMKEALIGWLIFALVHWAWNLWVSLCLEKAAFGAQGREAIFFFFFEKWRIPSGHIFNVFLVFLLGLLDTNCISLSSNKWHQSWSHLSVAHRKEQRTEHVAADFFVV